MKEQLINSETAKLAKEKGFFDKNIYNEVRLSQPKFYTKQGDLKTIEQTFYPEKDFKIEQCYNAPTQSLLQKWLREVHKIDVLPTKISTTTVEKYYFKIMKNDKWIDTENSNSTKYLTHEQAFEIGLQEVLDLIPSEK